MYLNNFLIKKFIGGKSSDIDSLINRFCSSATIFLLMRSRIRIGIFLLMRSRIRIGIFRTKTSLPFQLQYFSLRDITVNGISIPANTMIHPLMVEILQVESLIHPLMVEILQVESMIHTLMVEILQVERAGSTLSR